MSNAALPIQKRFRTTDEWEAWNRAHLPPPTANDGPILIGTGGRRATREELIAFVARERERIAHEHPDW